MKISHVVLVVFFFLGASELKAQEWTEENTKWEYAYYVTHLIDWGQTLEIARNPGYKELNPILGEYPTEAEVNRYFLLSGIAHHLLARWLDEYRLPYQQATFLINFGAIANNASIGIKIKF